MEDGVGQGNGAGLETVRALHQTVTALRQALEESKNEILQLKSQAWPVESVQETLRNLSIENHILRRKLLNTKPESLDELPQLEQSTVDNQKLKTDIYPVENLLKEDEVKDTDLIKGTTIYLTINAY